MLDRYFTPLASVLALIVFLLANTFFQPLLASWRVDFTQGDQYSLSNGTRSTVQNLAEPVDLTFVYTRRVGQDYPAVRAYAQRVRELLQAYQSTSRRRLRLIEIDPTPFSKEEDEAVSAGITAVQTDGTDPLYFGLIGRNAVDDELVIPFLAPEREATLEYDLTRLIARLDKPEPATIGIITDLENFKGDGKGNGYFALREIAAVYQVAPIASDFTVIPEDVDVLLLAHAASLTARQSYLVDQFILHKGRALILVDPASKAAAAGGVFNTGGRIARSDLGPLGDAWGITLSDAAVADVANALPVSVPDGGRVIEVGQPLFIGVPRSLMSSNDLITSALSRPVNLGAPGALEAFPPQGVIFDPLMRTDEAPSYIDAALASGEATPQNVIQAYESEDGQMVLAGRLSGSLSTAFPDGPPPAEDIEDPVEEELARIGEAEGPPHINTSALPAEVVIIADADLLDDGFYIDPRSTLPSADNATLILNALDNLTGGAELLNLRSRAPNERPMTRVNNMREAAQDEFFDEQARLEARLAEAQRRLEELQAVGATGGFFSGDLEADLTPEERTELSELRQSVVETRERLRDIERDFRRNIDGLENMLRFINIWGGPLIVLLIGLIVWFRRRETPA